jgi:hypothetical protein
MNAAFRAGLIQPCWTALGTSMADANGLLTVPESAGNAAHLGIQTLVNVRITDIPVPVLCFRPK